MVLFLGHSDVVMGLVSLNSESLHDRLRFLQNSLGAVPSPIDCYLCNRGLKTLQVRMEKHFENGMAVAQFLESNPQVEKVIYPGMLICFLSTCGYSRILHVIPCILFM